MFRTIVLSVPLAIGPLAAFQLVETLLTQSLLPQVAENMQRAVEGGSDVAMPVVIITPVP